LVRRSGNRRENASPVCSERSASRLDFSRHLKGRILVTERKSSSVGGDVRDLADHGKTLMSENLHLVFSKPPKRVCAKEYDRLYYFPLGRILVVPGFRGRAAATS